MCSSRNGRQIELAVAGLIAVGHRVCVALVSSGGSLSTRLQALGASVRILNSKSSISLSVTAKVADIIGTSAADRHWMEC